MIELIAYHLFGFVVFCLFPAFVVGTAGYLIHPTLGLILFIGIMGFTMDLAFGDNREQS